MKNIMSGLFFGTILTFLFLYPLITNIETHLASQQDGPLVAWLINWGSHSFVTGKNIFHPPFFHPYEYALGYSDLFISTALFNIPVYLLSKNIVLNHNLHLISGSILVFTAQFLLAEKLFKDKAISLTTALIFSFSNMHLDYIAHLHVFLVAGIPIFFLSLLNFIETEKTKWIVLMHLSALYQFLNSPMSGYFLLIASIPFLLDQKTRKKLSHKAKNIFPYTLGSALLVIFFYLPYIKVFQTFHITRSIRETAHTAFSLNKFWTNEILSLLTFCGLLVMHLKQRRLPFKNKHIIIFLLITVIGGLLMLGPALKVNGETFKVFSLPIPLPYAIFYYIVPGFKAFRASSRWIIVFAFGISILVGYLIKANRFSSWGKIAIFVTICFFLWNNQLNKFQLFEMPTTPPPIYQIIKNRPETSLAELPAYVWTHENYHQESKRLIFQSYHGKKLYNGLSGFAPPERELSWHTISDTISTTKGIEHLKNAQVELVLLHANEKAEYSQFQSPDMEKIICLETDCLYKIKY